MVPVFSTVVGEVGPPLCSDQALVAEHPYTFWPLIAVVTKNICPTLQVAGREGPEEKGFVEDAAEKSTDFDWVLRSTWVCPEAAAAMTVRSGKVLVTVSLISCRE
jgi:hypothetical protein